MKNINEYLDDVEYFYTHFSEKPGFNGIVQYLNSNPQNQIDAAAQTIRILKENPGGRFSPDKINRFEPALSDNSKHAGDIKIFVSNPNNPTLPIPVFVELKSYRLCSILGTVNVSALGGNCFPGIKALADKDQFQIPDGQFAKYIGSDDVENITNLEYIFDVKKLIDTGDYSNMADAIADLKGQFKFLFQKTNISGDNKLFEHLSERNQTLLRNLLNIGNGDINPFIHSPMLLDLINDTNSVLYDFIKLN